MPYSQAHFTPGDPVEVLDPYPTPTYFPATVIRPPDVQKNLVFVEYETPTDHICRPKELQEYVDLGLVRPRVPGEVGEVFKVGHSVDAYWESGWRRGTIMDICDSCNYLVLCDGNGEEIEVEQCNLRVHRKWVDGSWVPPLQEQQINSSDTELRSGKIRLKIKFGKKSLVPKFTKNSIVEVSSDEKGYEGSRYTAVIVDSIDNDRFLVEYLTLRTNDETQPLREEAYECHIRPYPPDFPVKHFRQFQAVDVWYNEGWWEGEIFKVLRSLKYIVYFSTTNEYLVYEHSNLRPHQEWINGKWVIGSKENFSGFEVKPSEVMEDSVSNLKAKFRKGTKVEVKSNEAGFRGSWYTAIIANLIEKDKFEVEYQTLKTNDETGFLKEIADMSDIRPCPPDVQRVYPFALLEAVDAWYNDGWWTGYISKVLFGSKYMVYFRTSNEELEFEHCDLRPHQEWSEGNWVFASSSRDWMSYH